MEDLQNIPECFYRISIKALVLNESRDKFLIVQEPDGLWELPGGGLDWGFTPQQDLPREIMEEMGIKTTFVAENSSYFFTGESRNGIWVANLIYEAKIESLDFTPSDECVAVRFVGKEDIDWLKNEKAYWNVQNLMDAFDPQKHQ